MEEELEGGGGVVGVAEGDGLSGTDGAAAAEAAAVVVQFQDDVGVDLLGAVEVRAVEHDIGLDAAAGAPHNRLPFRLPLHHLPRPRLCECEARVPRTWFLLLTPCCMYSSTKISLLKPND